MTLAKLLLKTRRVGIRNFRNALSQYIKKNIPLVITEHGTPTSVLLPYEDMLEIIDVFDELQDEETLKDVVEGRKAIRRGVKGILASTVFKCKGKK